MPGQLHVDDERRDPLVLGATLDGGGVGAHQEEAPLGEVGGGDPDLAAGDDVLVAVEHGQGAQVGEVGSRFGLGEALAPVDVGVEDPREPHLLLLLGAPAQDHGPDLPQAVGVVDARRLGPRHLLGVDGVLHDGGLAASPGLRPVDGGPPAPVQAALPGLAAQHRAAVRVVLVPDLPRGHELRQVGVEPAAQLGSEGVVLGGVGEVHGSLGIRDSGRQCFRTSGFTMLRGVAPASRRHRSSAMVWVWLTSVS